MTREDFMENTLDVWEIPAESATRVGHPAPFPIELPARLIDLYTYRGDLVLDPFAGSGTAAVAAVRSGRHYVGYDLDDAYIRLAEGRVSVERQRLAEESRATPRRTSLPAVPAPARVDEGGPPRAVREGRGAKEIARSVLEAVGFTDIRKDQRQPGGVEVDFTGRDHQGRLWFFEVAGSFTSHRAGLQRSEALWKVLGQAAVLHQSSETPFVVLTADAAARGTGAEAIRLVTGSGKPIHAVIELVGPEGWEELKALCAGGRHPAAG